MTKKSLMLYDAPQVEEHLFADTAVFCASEIDVTSDNEGFTEGNVYEW